MKRLLNCIWGTRKGRIFLVVLSIILCTHFWLTWRIHRLVDHFCRKTINQESLSFRDVVLVYDDLLEPLRDELSNGFRISTRPYDAFEFDFTRCTHTAFVTTKTHRLGLRLRFDPFRNKFHVVGYWTIK
jgi:hypothetical protein